MGTAEINVPTSAAMYAAGLEGLTRIDERILSTWEFPPLYEAGVRYKKEPRDVWRHVVDVWKARWGDCEDLASWRAAELRVSGEDPGAFVYVYQSAPTKYHAIVERGDGSFEDPSRILGMRHDSPVGQLEGDDMTNDAYNPSGDDDQDGDEGAPPEDYGEEPQAAPNDEADIMPDRDDQTSTRAPIRQPVRRVARVAKKAKRKRSRRMARFARLARRFVLPVTPNEVVRGARAFVGVGDDPEPHNDSLTFDLYKSGRGWSGIVRLPTAAGRAMFMHTSPSPSKAAAAAKSMNLAKMAASSSAIRALVPPQAQAALSVLRSPIGRAVTKGLLKKFG